jgi:hypothetical protein
MPFERRVAALLPSDVVGPSVSDAAPPPSITGDEEIGTLGAPQQPAGIGKRVFALAVPRRDRNLGDRGGRFACLRLGISKSAFGCELGRRFTDATFAFTFVTVR